MAIHQRALSGHTVDAAFQECGRWVPCSHAGLAAGELANARSRSHAHPGEDAGESMAHILVSPSLDLSVSPSSAYPCN